MFVIFHEHTVCFLKEGNNGWFGYAMFVNDQNRTRLYQTKSFIGLFTNESEARIALVILDHFK